VMWIAHVGPAASKCRGQPVDGAGFRGQPVSCNMFSVILFTKQRKGSWRIFSCCSAAQTGSLRDLCIV
jgi:hypothetical protein